jgi:hypothetical protein
VPNPDNVDVAIPPLRLSVGLFVSKSTLTSPKTCFVWTDALRRSRQSHQTVRAYYVISLYHLLLNLI